jgi:tRNA modification GTPase
MSTIFAPISPMIKSAVSMVRISGPNAGEALSRLARVPLPKPRMATVTALRAPHTGQLIDKALVLWFPGPHSFTGEDSAELHLHGSRAVMRHCLEALGSMTELGLRYAEPGEFSRRAFENGKMDLTEAEGLADLIESETTLQATQALRQMGGALKTLYDNWRHQLVELMAYVEAYIDFPEEDIPADIVADFTQRLSIITTQVSSHLEDNRRGETLRHGIFVAIIGAPNAGKSTLLNQLSQRDVAIVSEQAGTTRDVLEVHLDIAGYPFVLADTAGLRSSTDVIEQEGVKRALSRAHEADIKLAVFDITQEIDNATLAQIDERTIILMNKLDDHTEDHVLTLPNIPQDYTCPIIAISAKSGKNIPQLLELLQAHAAQKIGVGEDPVITRARHRALLQEALLALSQCNSGQPIELYAEYLRIAATSLGKITGHIDVEEILDSLFRHFCIGK